MSKYALSFLLIAFIAFAPACAAQDAPAGACHDLRDHVVTLRMQSVLGLPAERERTRQTMERVLGDKFLASCEQTLTPAQRDCELAATSLRAAEACAPKHGRVQ